MVRTLEIPELVEEIDEAVPEADDPDNQELETPEPPESDEPVQTPELTPDEQIAAYLRKEQVLRDAQTELVNLERTVADLRREVNGYKEPIADARSKVARLISCDVHGFLKWEKEQELPLLLKAEESANAWRNLPIFELDVTAKDKELLAEHFKTCGAVADWLCKDFPEKKKGLNGEVTKERLRTAINKISGTENDGNVNKSQKQK